MTPERWRQIEELYHAAQERGPTVLADVEPELRQEVERLLAQDSGGKILDVPAAELAEWLSGPVLGMGYTALVNLPSTLTQPAPAGPMHFPPGTVLAQRYRIIYLLGRGGMGEVYRADDLVLGQPVALKFLPAASEAALSRFRNEVRTARQVSHPNVCRVYDIGGADGLTYLSMEYVDGEDLASLLRRIGKLPQDKALEIARQLCAGLAAAHDKGVIHRDLKPANIMLDGRGHVRITDFGIAGVAAQIRDFRSGTPDYMSPEQLAGKEVTPRSDIYALGIVLCELMTGKRPPLQPAEPGTTAVDPAIERVIERCLDPDPEIRPPSALAVSAALPGDPLAAALARGETPAPEVVANAGPVGGLRLWVAVTCLALVIAGFGLLCVLRQKHDLINQIPMENSSEVLASKARDVAKEFGYIERPADVLYAWSYDTDYLRYANQRQKAPLAPYPPAVYFWYRQSPEAPHIPEEYFEFDQAVFRSDALKPGMQSVVLSSEGELLEFYARPSAVPPAANSPQPFDWNRLFVAAGLDPARVQPARPSLSPTVPFDVRAAWTGAGKGNEHLRIEAASYQRQPVFFRILGPWTGLSTARVSLGIFSLPMIILFLLTVPLAVGLVAWRNSRSGRGDATRAWRMAAFGFSCMFCNDFAFSHHVAGPAEFIVLFGILRYAVYVGCLVWVSYMALEPLVRKQLPASLISWNRLVAGRFRDPLAGGHILVGITLGVGATCAANSLLPMPFDALLVPALQWSGASPLLAQWFFHPIVATGGGIIYLFFLSLILKAVRRQWLATSLFVILGALILAPGYSGTPPATIGHPAIILLALAIALTRFGLLAAVALVFTETSLLHFPLTTNWSAWYAGWAVVGLATVLAVGLYSFVITLKGRPLGSPRRINLAPL